MLLSSGLICERWGLISKIFLSLHILGFGCGNGYLIGQMSKGVWVNTYG